MSNINLIGIEFSKLHFYPGETLYVKCTFQAVCDNPTDKFVKLYADFSFGHMNIDAPDNSSYTRAVSAVYPQPMCYKKGEIWSSSIRWNIPASQYPGALEVRVGFVDDDMEYVPFNVNGREYNRFYAGDINVAFDGAGKTWIEAHSEPEIFTYKKDDIVEENRENNGFDCIVCYRDVNSDKEVKTYAQIGKNESFENGAVGFTISQDGESFIIDNVIEKDGFEFLNVKIPVMYSMSESKMITMYGEGRLADCTSYPWGYEQKYYVRNVGIITNGTDSILMEAPYIDEVMHYSVCEKNGRGMCALGITLTHRIRCFGELESVKVINKPTVMVKNIKGGWQECVPQLRKGVKKKTDKYDRCIFYYYTICEGPGMPVARFSEALEYIKQMYYITGGVRQYMIMCGWQHDGHDTGYPDVFKLVDGAGTLEELRECMAEAKKYNACMTFHDNYDDMYEDNGYFQADCAAINPKGKNLTSWIWVGGVSTIMSFPKYYKTGKMQERVRKTVEMLGIDDTYHIDVLSCEARRYDFDPAVKMAGQEVLEYKRAVVQEFEKYGITVTSEGLSHAFAGVMGCSWRMTEGKFKLFSDEIYVPMTAMIYHGLVPYAGEGKFGIINGAIPAPERNRPPREFKESFFLKALPMGMLCNQSMNDYKLCDGIHEITYSGGKVIYDEKNDDITVICGDDVLTQKGNTFVKGYCGNQYLGFSKSGNFSTQIKPDVTIKGVYGFEENGEKKPLEYNCSNSRLEINMECATAFLVETEKGNII